MHWIRSQCEVFQTFPSFLQIVLYKYKELSLQVRQIFVPKYSTYTRLPQFMKNSTFHRLKAACCHRIQYRFSSVLRSRMLSSFPHFSYCLFSTSCTLFRYKVASRALPLSFLLTPFLKRPSLKLYH